ncbi:MAG: DEAD/DEAH box helicase [Oscillospiraceae bacterium]
MIYAPHPYQAYSIDRLIHDEALGLFLEPGLGKTVITLTAVNDLKYNRFRIQKALVIAPKRVAEATWSKEAAKWEHLKHLKIVPILGSLTKRIRALNTPGDIWIINRENVEWLVDYLGHDWCFDMVVIDESTSFKSHQAKRWKALKRIRPRISRIVELTGTPAPNGIMDLWAQIYLLDGGQRLGKTIGGFRERYFDSNAHGGHFTTFGAKDDAEGAIQALIGDICVSMKAEDYLLLPDVVVDEIPVVLDDKVRKQYNELEREAILETGEDVITAAGAAALSNKLLQLCNGAVYDADGNVVEIHSCKLDAFIELIEALSGQPALVFYNFKHDLTRLEAALSKTKLRVRRLNGPQDEADWNARNIDILLAHPASCAYGLNLQDGGNHVIWFGLNWSLELYMQANKRLHRQGQRQKVIIHQLAVVGGRDEDVVQALNDKGTTQEALINSLKARIEKIKEELK